MVENRLLPQFERAYDKFSEKYGTSNEDALAFQSMGAEVFDRAKDVLAGVDDAKPSLLHGGEQITAACKSAFRTNGIPR